jgi:hypothetical protein
MRSPSNGLRPIAQQSAGEGWIFTIVYSSPATRTAATRATSRSRPTASKGTTKSARRAVPICLTDTSERADSGRARGRGQDRQPFREHDGKHDQDRDSADVDKDLDHRQEIRPLNQEQAGHPDQAQHQPQRGPEQGGAPHRDRPSPEGNHGQHGEGGLRPHHAPPPAGPRSLAARGRFILSNSAISRAEKAA